MCACIYTHIYMWILQNYKLIIGELNKIKCVQGVGTERL